LTITGNVIGDNSNKVRPLVSVSAPSDSVDQLLDRFVGQLLVRQSGVADASVAEIMSQSLPAIRAYLNGRAAYRRADEATAIESFTRAIDIDSTFALAALDLTAATGKLLRTNICRINACRVFSVVPGLPSSERSDDLFNRAVRLAWAHRVKLGKRDLPLLEALRGENYPRESSASQVLVGLTRAIAASPDRPETHYLLGVLLLYQGSAIEVPDSRARAEAEFREASKLDSSYLAPLARMVDAAAFDRDREKLRRAGASYLARDSVGPTSDYVRWVIAAGTGDVVGERAIRARLRSLSTATLEQIFVTSQMAGVALEDADSATSIIAENSTDPIDKSVAFRRGQLLSLNRGRPSAANDFLARVDAQRSSTSTVRSFAIASALFEGGERGVAESRVREQAREIARDTLLPPRPDAVRRISAVISVQSLWYLDVGDTTRARAAGDWLRRHTEGQPRNRALSVLPEMLIASRARRANGAALRAFVDSVLRRGCCEVPEYVIVVLERAYEASGDAAGALRVVRRGMWYLPPRQLSTLLREDGRLSSQLGDRDAAIRAYDHYLALRSDPEPALRPERDRIRAEVARLKSGR
jgi:tetratricopeptide (TPR) repeat protein